MDEIKGMVKRVKYHNETNGYSVFSFVPDENKNKEFSCVGFIESLEEGDYLIVAGEFEEHSTYGKQLKTDYIRKSIPTDVKVFANYLALSIDGIGPTLAKRIVKCFGADTFKIIENNYKELTKVEGISKKKAEKINEQFVAQNVTREEQMLFLSLGISTAYMAKIKKTYGDEARKVLYSNPYKLIEDVKGIGFQKADSIASKVGIPTDSKYRIYHGTLYLLEQYANMKGHVYYPRSLLIQETAQLLKVGESKINDVLELLIDDGKVVYDDEKVYLSIYAFMENYIANFLIKKKNESTDKYDREIVLNKIKNIESKKNVTLDESQREAVYQGIINNIMIMTGGPGTGKTTTIDTMIRFFVQEENKSISLAAPTGRAAKRMSEQTKRHAQTIHSLIGQQKEEGEMFEDDAMIDSDVVVIDEVSMVDIVLMYSLLKTIREGTKIILVGDVDQLPSVGPGKILKDMIASEVLPVSQLTKIHRQGEKSTIIPNAHKINKGIKIDIDEESEDFFFVRRKDARVVIQNIFTLMSKNLPHQLQCKPTDIQVLAPMKKGVLGIENLNILLQNHLNPKSPCKKEIEHINIIFREGDKVMHIKNNYKMEWTKGKKKGSGVFNGEVGFIQNVDIENKALTVLFEDGRLATYEKDNFNELTLAYAITIHKSQGSEYPAIIIPILNGGPPTLYNKNLLYTAVTRAKDCVIILGQPKHVYTMIKNTKAEERYSGLKEKLQKI